MNIGIDFDNTIARYDMLFQKVALEEGFISKNSNCTEKTELRDYLYRLADGKKKWMKLQGLVYGKHMHGAEIMPGVANFFLSCKIRYHNIYIISHKTEYGHYDSDKFSLRQEALKWMESNSFFEPNYFGIKKENIFFANTRKDKINKIRELRCDWFIDDLQEVLEDNLFPIKTKKILLGSSESEPFYEIKVLNSWIKISEFVLGQATYNDLISWSNCIIDEPIKGIEKIKGRGNSSVYKLTASDEKCYLLKNYPDQASDKRPRLKAEFQALQIFEENNINNVPKPIGYSSNLNLGLYEWVDGEKVTKPSVDEIEEAINFVKNLYSLSSKIDRKIALASEACLSGVELIYQINNRLLRLKRESDNFHELSIFIKRIFEPLWHKVKEQSIILWPEESRDSSLHRDKQILSPSDFGFHNSLKLVDGGLSFIDFDYFGWDDPVKLTSDFLWHPAMKLNEDLKLRWQEAMLELFNKDKLFEDRFNAAMPLYGMRWALIVLNEFLPAIAERRKLAGEIKSYDIVESRETQLNKAKRCCDKVKTIIC